MYTNINYVSRFLRVALSLGLVFAVLNAAGPLGALVYAPFVSIYAGITGFIGWDPLYALVSEILEGHLADGSQQFNGELVHV
jgi:hypothetical protein